MKVKIKKINISQKIKKNPFQYILFAFICIAAISAVLGMPSPYPEAHPAARPLAYPRAQPAANPEAHPVADARADPDANPLIGALVSAFTR